MKTMLRVVLAVCILLAAIDFCTADQTTFYFGLGSITQENPEPAQSLTVSPLKLAPEINFFESDSDLNNVDFIGHNIFATYNYSVVSSGINGGAADWLNIVSSKSLAYSGDAPGKIILNSYFDGSYMFDPGFSKFDYLVFDIQNTGTMDISIIPRIGPNGYYSGSAMYYGYDSGFAIDNIRIISPGTTGTFVFELGGHPNFYGSPIVWDYYDDPSNVFELEFQPVEGSAFSVLIDNIGFATVPEPCAGLMFVLGLILLKKIIRK